MAARSARPGRTDPGASSGRSGGARGRRRPPNVATEGLVARGGQSPLGSPVTVSTHGMGSRRPSAISAPQTPAKPAAKLAAPPQFDSAPSAPPAPAGSAYLHPGDRRSSIGSSFAWHREESAVSDSFPGRRHAERDREAARMRILVLEERLENVLQQCLKAESDAAASARIRDRALFEVIHLNEAARRSRLDAKELQGRLALGAQDARVQARTAAAEAEGRAAAKYKSELERLAQGGNDAAREVAALRGQLRGLQQQLTVAEIAERATRPAHEELQRLRAALAAAQGPDLPVALLSAEEGAGRNALAADALGGLGELHVQLLRGAPSQQSPGRRPSAASAAATEAPLSPREAELRRRMMRMGTAQDKDRERQAAREQAVEAERQRIAALEQKILRLEGRIKVRAREEEQRARAAATAAKEDLRQAVLRKERECALQLKEAQAAAEEHKAAARAAETDSQGLQLQLEMALEAQRAAEAAVAAAREDARAAREQAERQAAAAGEEAREAAEQLRVAQRAAEAAVGTAREDARAVQEQAERQAAAAGEEAREAAEQLQAAQAAAQRSAEAQQRETAAARAELAAARAEAGEAAQRLEAATAAAEAARKAAEQSASATAAAAEASRSQRARGDRLADELQAAQSELAELRRRLLEQQESPDAGARELALLQAELQAAEAAERAALAQRCWAEAPRPAVPPPPPPPRGGGADAVAERRAVIAGEAGGRWGLRCEALEAAAELWRLLLRPQPWRARSLQLQGEETQCRCAVREAEQEAALALAAAAGRAAAQEAATARDEVAMLRNDAVNARTPGSVARALLSKDETVERGQVEREEAGIKTEMVAEADNAAERVLRCSLEAALEERHEAGVRVASLERQLRVAQELGGFDDAALDRAGKANAAVAERSDFWDTGRVAEQAEAYAATALEDLGFVFRRLMDMYDSKPGDVADELAQNLRFPPSAAALPTRELRDAASLELLAEAAHATAGLKGVAEELPDVCAAELLALRMYTQRPLDIDRDLGWGDVPPAPHAGESAEVSASRTEYELRHEDWDWTKHVNDEKRRNGSVFHPVCLALRSRVGDPAADKVLQKWVKWLCTVAACCARGPVGMDKDSAAPESEPTEVWRGLGGGGLPATVVAAHRRLSEGDTLGWPALSSTSHDRESSEAYMRGTAANSTGVLTPERPGTILFQVSNVCTGREIGCVSAYPSESERLLGPLTVFRVQSCSSDPLNAYGQGLLIDMECIGPLNHAPGLDPELAEEIRGFFCRVRQDAAGASRAKLRPSSGVAAMLQRAEAELAAAEAKAAVLEVSVAGVQDQMLNSQDPMSKTWSPRVGAVARLATELLTMLRRGKAAAALHRKPAGSAAAAAAAALGVAAAAGATAAAGRLQAAARRRVLPAASASPPPPVLCGASARNLLIGSSPSWCVARAVHAADALTGGPPLRPARSRAPGRKRSPPRPPRSPPACATCGSP